jgi:peroxin-14
MSATRRDLVISAVKFLKDPQVASAPLAKKIEFLEFKDLTNDEIQEALALANSNESLPATTGYSASSSGQASTYTNNEPPPLPDRDWRDYFIMSTVSVGIGYGLYQLTKRFIKPLIFPERSPELVQDQQALETEFGRTGELLEQLQHDTTELAAATTANTTAEDEAIEAVRSSLKQLQEFTQGTLTDDFIVVKNQVDELVSHFPKSIEKNGDVQRYGLKEIENELKSLKNLVSTRIKVSSAHGSSVGGIGVPTTSTSLVSSISGATATAPAIPAWQLALGNK